MKPLNLSSIIWLSGTRTELDKFISESQQKHRAVLLGHSPNIRSQLIRIAKWDNLEGLQGYIVKNSKEANVEAAFLLVQGQVIGLLVEPEKPPEVPEVKPKIPLEMAA